MAHLIWFLWYAIPIALIAGIMLCIAVLWGNQIDLPFYPRFALVVFAAMGAARPFWQSLFGGSFWTPVKWIPFAFALDVWFFTSLTLFAMLCLRGLVNVIGTTLLHGTVLIDPANVYVSCGMLAVSFVIALYGVYQGYAPPTVTTYEVAIRNLPDKADGYTIAFVSDTHICRTIRRKRVHEIVNRTNALKANLIALGGDYQDGFLEELRPKLEVFVRLTAPDGVYGVMGNHEAYGWDRHARAAFYRNNGIEFLNNQHVTIKHQDGTPLFTLAGITDPAVWDLEEASISPSKARNIVRPSMDKALEGAEENLPVIMLSHRPKAFKKAPPQVALMLSGHTHGGSAPIFNLITRATNGGYVAGEYKRGNQTLIVSRGAQQWMGWAFRLFNPAEIVLVTLSKAK